MRAVFNEVTIARSDDVVLLEGNHYFPADAVDCEHLRGSRAKSFCFWKGVASYYHVEAGGRTAPRAAWTYRHPSPLARKIKGRIAFWGDVQVVDE